jgi:anaerobic magnesium-protoporphyrin IX monomethyl ester cyclase
MIVLTHGYFLEEDEKERKIMKPYVPLGLLYLSAYLEEKGLGHEVYDSTFSSFEKFKLFIKEKKPALLGIYTNLMTKLSVLKMIRFVKNEANLKDCKIVLGGPEIRHNAERYLKQGADLLVIGEGEQSFYEICASYINTNTLKSEIKGLAYLYNNQAVFTAERPLIKDMDSLPMPARHKIDLCLYGEAWKKNHGYSMYSVSTMRGCPYTCKWCSRAVYGGTYRRRSARLVVEEMSLLQQKYQPDRIWFVDDVFTISHKWLKEFRNAILEKNIRIPYEIITRADRMNPEVISILKETGCFRVWIGAESGSQKIIDAMDRRVDVKTVGEMIIKTREAGIEAGTFIMLGYPGEKKSDIKATIRHLNYARPSQYTITVAYPITGTPLYHEVKANITTSDNWENISDRDYNFKRNHSIGYYNHALAWVHNEVNYLKACGLIDKAKYKTKSIIAQLRMLMNYGT